MWGQGQLFAIVIKAFTVVAAVQDGAGEGGMGHIEDFAMRAGASGGYGGSGLGGSGAYM